MVKKGWFICDCGEEVKITKHKLDTEKGIIYVMSEEEIKNFRHNKKCSDCIEKEDNDKEENDKDKIWNTVVKYDDCILVDSYFKQKDKALHFIMLKLRELFDTELCYDEDGDLITNGLAIGLESHKLN